MNPLGIPDVQLLDVNVVKTEVPQALLGALQDVAVRKHLPDTDAGPGRPTAVLGGHLGGHIDGLRRLAHHLAHQSLTVTVAVNQSRVYEIQTQFQRPAQRRQRLAVIAPEPLSTADSPGTVTNLADLQPCSSQSSVAHSPVTILA
jgi:hypothetical protein